MLYLESSSQRDRRLARRSSDLLRRTRAAPCGVERVESVTRGGVVEHARSMKLRNTQHQALGAPALAATLWLISMNSRYSNNVLYLNVNETLTQVVQY